MQLPGPSRHVIDRVIGVEYECREVAMVWARGAFCGVAEWQDGAEVNVLYHAACRPVKSLLLLDHLGTCTVPRNSRLKLPRSFDSSLGAIRFELQQTAVGAQPSVDAYFSGAPLTYLQKPFWPSNHR